MRCVNSGLVALHLKSTLQGKLFTMSRNWPQVSWKYHMVNPETEAQRI